jgi:hypothetical protein
VIPWLDFSLTGNVDSDSANWQKNLGFYCAVGLDLYSCVVIRNDFLLGRSSKILPCAFPGSTFIGLD